MNIGCVVPGVRHVSKETALSGHFPNVYIAKRRGVVPNTRGPLVTGKAAETMGLKRPQFVLLAKCLRLETFERPGKHGGKPAKYYTFHDVILAKTFLEQCAREGGRTVLKGLLGGRR